MSEICGDGSYIPVGNKHGYFARSWEFVRRAAINLLLWALNFDPLPEVVLEYAPGLYVIAYNWRCGKILRFAPPFTVDRDQYRSVKPGGGRTADSYQLLPFREEVPIAEHNDRRYHLEFSKTPGLLSECIGRNAWVNNFFVMSEDDVEWSTLF